MTDLPDSVPDDIRSAWLEHIETLAAGVHTERGKELRRVADAARRVVHGMVMTDLDVDVLRDAATQLETVASAFDRSTTRSMYAGFGESANAGDPQGFFEHGPMLGHSNPLAPPIALSVLDDKTMKGVVTFAGGYEGPPGCVHGGYIAAAFDEVLGATQSLSGTPGMTGRLSVDYRSPTPLHEELVFTGIFEGREGRKNFTTGTLHVGDRLCAEAQGLFISIDFGRLAEMEQARDDHHGAGTPRPD
ncbi:PaaI family thioesterase [Actinospongicola halichondriae]|uniref:PaaI family thioesterase n=1 Tax=Actinospongicola halichondriae TaxID=3236844 RepID=UPI003D3EF665